MQVHPRQFVRFIDGRSALPIRIASLPAQLGARIGCNTSEIKVSKDYAKKIIVEHKLRYEHFSLIQPIIDLGWCVTLKSNHLEFYYQDDSAFGAWFTLVVKTTKWGTECWVVTLFRARAFYIRSKLKRARQMNSVIQYHAGAIDY